MAATLHSLDGTRLATGSSFEQTTGQLKAGADVVLLDEAAARDLAERLAGAASRCARPTRSPTRASPTPRS
jgi:DNA topoisomerase-1